LKEQVKSVDGRFPTLCGMCGRYTKCGMHVTVVDNRITAVEPMPEHIGGKGFFCAKAIGALEFQYSSARLTHPLKKVRGKLQRCSWDEALDTIFERLSHVKSRHGAESVAIYLGMVLTPMIKYAKRFCDLFGTPNICSAASYCNYSSIIANVMTYGARTEPDIANSKTILVCGSNPANSNRTRFNDILAARRKGAKLIVLDPRKTETAKSADMYAAIRPGTDLALGLALLHVVITENLYDKAFVAQYTAGFDRLARHVEKYTPDWAAEITWVPAAAIREMARVIATNTPTSFVTGISPQHATNGCQAVRSFSILAALCGSLDVPGGNLFPAGAARVNSFRIKDKFPKIKGIGVDKFPLHFRMLAEANTTAVKEAILTGQPYPIRAMLIQGGNPISAWPDAERTKEALKKLEFLAVMDLRMTETAKLADIVLPAAFFLERTSWDMWPILAIQNRIVEPLAECRSDWAFWRELAGRFGWGDEFPWETMEEAIDWELEPSGVTVQRMKGNPGGFRLFEWSPKRYVQAGFNTPSKRVEIYSERMEGLGYDPLPTYYESDESPVSQPSRFRNHPLILTTGAREKPFNHSELHDCPSLLVCDPQPRVEIHPHTAGSLGIRHNDPVWVETARGRAKFLADVRADIDPRVVEAKHGWPGKANANRLTSGSQDPISGFPPFRVSLCRVYAAE
jgi:formate dehydrogenase (coenzyme F420) alpha subunit